MSPPADETRHPVEHRFALAAWEQEPPLVDEKLYTPWAGPGWTCWNRMSPEREYCDFVVSLVKVVQPQITIETGTGQGFLTRRLKPSLGATQRLVCFEGDPGWREALATLDFFDGAQVALSPEPTPTEAELAAAEICVLDSGHPGRSTELETWWDCAKSGALVVVHDVSSRHPSDSGHAKLARLVSELRIPGFHLQNPRGGFVGMKL